MEPKIRTALAHWAKKKIGKALKATAKQVLPIVAEMLLGTRTGRRS